MTKETYQAFQQAAMNGTIEDAQNPVFMFTLTDTRLLMQIASGELDARQLARLELMNRGLSAFDGSFIGFSKAEEQFDQNL